MTSSPSTPGRPAGGNATLSEPSETVLERLERLHPKEIDLALDRVERLLQTLGNPHMQLDGVVHVAGTNGKGSVVACMRAILEAAGRNVHAFTSPHLVRFHERIVLGGVHGGQQIPERELGDTLRRVEAANAGAPITFFEITTVAAFLAFAEHPTEYTLLETGLGGRLDATNVVARPALTVITPISRDHERFLGNDLAGIAFEKAGIMKPGVPCVTSRQQPEVMEVLEVRAAELDVPLIAQGVAWDAFEQHGRLVFQTESSLLDLPLPRLAGRHQIDNAGMALAAVRALPGADVEMTDMAEGLTSTQWPGRLQNLAGSTLQEMLPEGSEIWLDGGHNEAAARVLAHAMAEMEERAPLPLHLVCGMLNNKDARAFFRQFATLAEWVGAVAIPGQKNSLAAEELAATANDEGLSAQALPDLTAALEASTARASGPVRVLICGSLYFAGEVLAALEKGNPGA